VRTLRFSQLWSVRFGDTQLFFVSATQLILFEIPVFRHRIQIKKAPPKATSLNSALNERPTLSRNLSIYLLHKWFERSKLLSVCLTSSK